MSERIMEEIMRPTVRAMATEGRLYQGVLYAGLMLVNRGRGSSNSTPLWRSRSAGLNDAAG